MRELRKNRFLPCAERQKVHEEKSAGGNKFKIAPDSKLMKIPSEQGAASAAHVLSVDEDEFVLLAAMTDGAYLIRRVMKAHAICFLIHQSKNLHRLIQYSAYTLQQSNENLYFLAYVFGKFNRRMLYWFIYGLFEIAITHECIFLGCLRQPRRAALLSLCIRVKENSSLL
jgi:hypothetical protein